MWVPWMGGFQLIICKLTHEKVVNAVLLLHRTLDDKMNGDRQCGLLIPHTLRPAPFATTEGRRKPPPSLVDAPVYLLNPLKCLSFTLIHLGQPALGHAPAAHAVGFSAETPKLPPALEQDTQE